MYNSNNMDDSSIMFGLYDKQEYEYVFSYKDTLNNTVRPLGEFYTNYFL
jgi:hypothetical protein